MTTEELHKEPGRTAARRSARPQAWDCRFASVNNLSDHMNSKAIKLGLPCGEPAGKYASAFVPRELNLTETTKKKS